MKAFSTTIIAFLLFTITCKAQWTLTGGNIYPTVTSNNVVVGTTAPESGQRLDVSGSSALGTQGSARIYIGTSDATHAFIQSRNTSVSQNLTFFASSYNFTIGNVGIGTANPLALHHIVVPSAKATVTGSVASVLSTNDASNPFGLRTMIYGAPAIADRYVTMQTTDYSLVDGGDLVLQPASSGNVGIGTTNPDQKLTVNGTVHSKSVVVDNNIFPDYVFKKTYVLRPLSAVKTYIDLNHHLPEMPSAAEVAKNGQNLGEINALLLKKVEELTLYMIEKDKQILQQQDQFNQLKKQVEELKNAKK